VTGRQPSITRIAAAVSKEGGIEAMNLSVAERYVEAFSNVAKENNTLILPGNLSDMAGMVGTAMSIIKSQKTSPAT
jgi:hypothetical protein